MNFVFLSIHFPLNMAQKMFIVVLEWVESANILERPRAPAVQSTDKFKLHATHVLELSRTPRLRVYKHRLDANVFNTIINLLQFHYTFAELLNIPKMLSLWSQANRNPLVPFFDDVS
jgi:hypothetical protein